MWLALAHLALAADGTEQAPVEPVVLLPPTPAPTQPTPLPQPFRAPPLPPQPPDPPPLERYLNQVPPATVPSAQVAQPPAAITTKPAGATPEQSEGKGPAAPLPSHAAIAPIPTPTANPIYGELAEVGLRRLLNPYSYWSIGVGSNYTAGQLFLLTNPQIAIIQEQWQLQIQVPLNLQLAVFSDRSLKLGSFRIRREDWKEWSDGLKVIRLATFGHHEDPIYVAVGSILPLTLGHGILLNRYQSNLDINKTFTGVQLHLNQPFGGLQVALNDITLQQPLLGSLLFVRPLVGLSQALLRTISIGAEYVADFKAPGCILQGNGNNSCLQGANQQANTDRDNLTLQRSFAYSDRSTGFLNYQTRLIHAVGMSLEGQFFRHEQLGNCKLYGTWHRFLQAGGGDGFALGVLSRLFFGQTWQQALRIRTEMRLFGTGFRPSYFDTTYNLNKLAYGQDRHKYQVVPTKTQLLFGDKGNGFPQATTGQRVGFRLDGQWALFVGGRANKRIAVAAGIEGSNGENDALAYAHVELPLFRELQVMGTIMRANVPTIGQLVQFATSQGGQLYAILAARFKFTPFAWINVYYNQTYGPSKLPGLEYQLGIPERIVDSSQRPSRFQFVDQVLSPITTLALELEFGWDL